jgi:hypothetical protein
VFQCSGHAAVLCGRIRFPYSAGGVNVGLIISKLRNFYHTSKAGRYFLRPFKLALNALEFNKWTDAAHIRRKFLEFHGAELNLENPLTFSEKLQWLKLNDRTELHTLCADKYRVRSYVESQIGGRYLIPLLEKLWDPNKLDLSAIADQAFVIKTNHDSGTVIIVRDKNRADSARIRRRLESAMKINFYHSSREWQYKNIRPRILVEKLLLDAHGEVPKDYKIHCFGGVPKFIQVDSDRFSDHGRAFYDRDWTEQEFTVKFPFRGGVPRPASLEEMLEVAAKLSRPFGFARVDLYDINGRVYFGEITFHPGSGLEQFQPVEWDARMGSFLRL